MATADEAAAVVEICRRLDGIPLAIELAASRMASMTASEVRDRLDHRFRLLVGSRRGLERHHTLRHAVAWSYDLLDDAEKTLLERCSVFAGGFDLQSACAVAGFDDLDDYAVLDLLDALVRKSLLVADRSAGADPVFDAGDDPPVRRGATRRQRRGRPRSGPPMLATSPGVKPTSWPCGTAPDSERRTTGSPSSWPTCAPRFGGPPTTAISTSPPPSPPTRGCSALWVENYEPIAWAEELIEPARAVDHPRLAVLYVMASQCYTTGRIEAAVRYSDAGQIVVGRSRDDAAVRHRGLCLDVAYLVIGQPERWVELCRAQLARRRDTHVTHPGMRWSSRLQCAGCGEEAMAAADGLIEAAEATGNPYCALVGARSPTVSLSATPIPTARLTPSRRGLVIAQDSGNRANESHLAHVLARLEAEHGDPLAALRSPHSGDPQLPRMRATPRRSASRWLSSPLFSTGSDATNRRPPSPVSRSVPSPRGGPRNHHRDHPPARCPRRPDLRIARPQGRNDDHRRDGRPTHTTKSTRPEQN